MSNQQSEVEPQQTWVAFALLTALQIWIAHAIDFFAHEYAHSTLAWALGWKANPLALDYGHLTLANLLLQSPIDENVDYAPIFASGHTYQAGMIAAAGVVLGNALITYWLARWLFAAARRKSSRNWAMLAFWLLVGSVGNLLCYVPVRTFSFKADMHTTARGFGCSPWVVLIVLGIPFAITLVHFFVRLEPQYLQWLFPNSITRQRVFAVITAIAIFGFYGIAGWTNSGIISHRLSQTSLYVLLPLMTLVGWLRINRNSVKEREAR